MNAASQQPTRTILAEVAVWVLLSCGFLLLYVGSHGHPAAGAYYHVILVGLGWWTLAMLRLATGRVLSSWRFAAVVSGCLMASGLALLAAYYALVIIGLESWGHVPTWALVSAYAHQAPDLLHVMGVSGAVVGALSAIAAALFIAVCWLCAKWFNWPWHVARRVGPRHWVILTSGLLLAWTAAAYEFTQGLWTHNGEPLSLSTFPQQWRLQNHAIDAVHASYRLRAEEQARRHYQTATLSDTRNVVIIVVDALRADRTGIGGYERDTTPFLTRLHQEGRVRLADAMWATCAESTCGLLALASSRYIHNFVPRPMTLADVLKKHGYEFHMVLGGDHTSFYGLRELYGNPDSYFDVSHVSGDFYVNDDRAVLHRLERFPHWNDAPTFLQIHLMSAHTLGKRFLDPTFSPEANYSSPHRRLALQGLRAQISNYYDNGVLQTDWVIEQIVTVLERKGYLENAILVVTGDHGEALGEHDLIAHANGVHEPLLRIPFLFIDFPAKGQGPAFPMRTASQVDIAPTILHELGIPAPETWEGVPLQLQTDRRFSHFRQGHEVGVVDHGDPSALWKYWVDMQSGREYVFDLTRDAEETVNLALEVPPELLNEWRHALAVPRNFVRPANFDL